MADPVLEGGISVLDDSDMNLGEDATPYNPLIAEEECYIAYPTLIPRDGEEVPEDAAIDLHFEVPLIPSLPLTETPCQIQETPKQSFRRHMVEGSPVIAASILVAQALFQNHHLAHHQSLPVPNIMLERTP